MARDRYMADAVASLIDGTSARIALWAHNGHITTGHYATGVPALGLHLRRRYGAAYYALGMPFGKGAFRARRGQDLTRPATRHRIGSAGPRSIESRLAAATPGDHLIDLRAAEAAPAVAEWLRDGHFQRSFGANVPRLTYRFNLAPTVPAEDYDGLAYVATTTCSRPLPQGPGPT